MRWVLCLLAVGLLLVGCGDNPATPVVIVITATAGLDTPTSAAPATLSVVVTDTPDAAATAQTYALATVDAENARRATLAAPIYATQTAGVQATAAANQERSEADRATMVADVFATQTVEAAPTDTPMPPPDTATPQPRPPPPRPVPPTAVPKPIAHPTARPAPQAPADCLTPAERAYVDQANAILDGIRPAEASMWANIDFVISDQPAIINPVKAKAFNRALDTLLTWVHKGDALHTPPEWQAAQSFWDGAMHAYKDIRLDIFTPPANFLVEADNFLVEYEDVLQPLIDARCQ